MEFPPAHTFYLTAKRAENRIEGRWHCKRSRLLRYDRGGEQLLSLLEDFSGVPLAASFLAKTCEKNEVWGGRYYKGSCLLQYDSGQRDCRNAVVKSSIKLK